MTNRAGKDLVGERQPNDSVEFGVVDTPPSCNRMVLYGGPGRYVTTLNVILIGAGRGNRLMPLTEIEPKPFAVIAGKRILDWTLLLTGWILAEQPMATRLRAMRRGWYYEMSLGE